MTESVARTPRERRNAGSEAARKRSFRVPGAQNRATRQRKAVEAKLV